MLRRLLEEPGCKLMSRFLTIFRSTALSQFTLGYPGTFGGRGDRYGAGGGADIIPGIVVALGGGIAVTGIHTRVCRDITNALYLWASGRRCPCPATFNEYIPA